MQVCEIFKKSTPRYYLKKSKCNWVSSLLFTCGVAQEIHCDAASVASKRECGPSYMLSAAGLANLRRGT